MIGKRLIGLLAGLCLWVCVGACTPARASDTYADPGTIWTGSLEGSGFGHCTVECENPTRGTNVRLHAKGLSPHTNYTAWWVDVDNRERPLGARRVVLRSDDRGSIDYQARLPHCPIGDRFKIIIRTDAKDGQPRQVLAGEAAQPQP